MKIEIFIVIVVIVGDVASLFDKTITIFFFSATDKKANTLKGGKIWLFVVNSVLLVCFATTKLSIENIRIRSCSS